MTSSLASQLYPIIAVMQELRYTERILISVEIGEEYMKKRVVISGMGVVSSVGCGVETFWQAICQGKSGIERISAYDPEPYPTQIAGEVGDFQLDAFPQYKKPKRYSRAACFALVCAHQALSDARLAPKSSELALAGTFIGTGQGGAPQGEDAYRPFFAGHWRKIPALSITRGMPNSIANQIAIACGLGGPNLTITNACMSSADAIGRAYEAILWGKTPRALAGGTEAMIWEGIMASWCKLKVMSTRNHDPERACRPFDSERDGMVMAEGAGMILLEDLDSARERGAPIYAEIIGYGSSCDAYHITAPDVAGQVRAVQQALDEAAVTADEIDYISAHGTSTLLNDIVETQTIKEVFAKRAYDVPISALKSMLGHSIGAAGVLEIAATALSLRDQIIHPTINLDDPDAECDLDYVPHTARRVELRTALSHHFAFGGANTVLVLRRWQERDDG